MARRRVLTMTMAAALAATAAWGPAATAQTLADPSDPAVVCASMKTDVFRVTNPQTEASLVTPSLREITGSAARSGFTEDGGALFKAAGFQKPGLVPVYRLFHARSGDFVWATSQGDRDRAVRFGYTLQFANFFASAKPLSCGVPVYRYLKGNKHRMAVGAADRAALEAAGWTSEGARFWAAPTAGAAPEPPVEEPPVEEPPVEEPPVEEPPVEEPPVEEPPVEEPPVEEPPVEEPPVEEPPVEEPPTDTDSTFTLAVIPDTQQDVFSSRISNRAQWLVQNEDDLDLRFVVHTGDLVNWDTPDHDQFVEASKAIKILDDARIPVALTIGNHDTLAVGVGGGARDPRRTRQLVRDTTAFNTYFPPSRHQPEGVFEQGKIDNNYQLFSAGNEDWMILTLELWPRPAAVAWAKDVVAKHPNHNVIVQTHSYLHWDGSIYGGKDYGDTSPKQLYKDLVSAYPNIRMVLSGHIGDAAQRVDTGTGGNKIVSFLGTFHSNVNNPIRLLKIDTAADTVTSTMYSPINRLSFPQYAGTWTDMAFD